MTSREEVLESLAGELQRRFQEQAGALIENVSKGLIHAVLQMNDKFVEGTQFLEHLSDGGKMRNDLTGGMSQIELTPGQKEAIACVLAFARMAHVDFPKSLIVRERLAGKDPTVLAKPLTIDEVDEQVRQVFQSTQDNWNPNVSDLTFNGLLDAIGQHWKEIPRLLTDQRPDQAAIISCVGIMVCHLTELLRKVDMFINPHLYRPQGEDQCDPASQD